MVRKETSDKQCMKCVGNCEKISAVTVEPRFNEPQYSEALGIKNYILRPSNSKIYDKKPLI